VRPLPFRRLESCPGTVALVAVVLTMTLALAALAAPPAAAATSAPPTAPPTSLPPTPPVSSAGGPLTRTAPVAIEGCNAQQVTLSVSIARDAFAVGQTVTFAVKLTNTTATACGPPLRSIPPGKRGLDLGPCGVLSAVVSDAAGANVYPGTQVFHCPAEFGVRLAANQTLRAEGTWMGYEAPSAATGTRWTQAGPGTYQVTVDKVVSVPFRLYVASASPAIRASPGLPFSTVPPPSSHPFPTPTLPAPTLPTPTVPAPRVG